LVSAALTEPENHTLRLLREIRSAIGALDRKLDAKITYLHTMIDRTGEALHHTLTATGFETRGFPAVNSVCLEGIFLPDFNSAPQLSATLTDDSGNS
jgi:hypothetical protein